jgi:hypothetical protein
MYLHANAKLGVAGRLALVRAAEHGCSLKAVAAAFCVSAATAYRWLDGGRQASALVDRSSRPHRSPRLLAAELQARICDFRRQTGWGRAGCGILFAPGCCLRASSEWSRSSHQARCRTRLPRLRQRLTCFAARFICGRSSEARGAR